MTEKGELHRSDNATTIPSKPSHILAAVYGQPWLISADGMNQVLAIANRITDVSALVSGRPVRPEGTRRLKVYGSTAVVEVQGTIIRYADVFAEMCGACSLQSVSHDFHMALEDPAINKIIFNVATNGGQAEGINEFAEIIYQARSVKTIIGYASGAACSAGLWILSACGEVYCDATSMLGSIGVRLSFQGENGEDKIIHVTSSQSPNKIIDVSSEEGHQMALATADSMAAVFVSAVARNRNVSTQTVINDFGQGWVLVGEEAVKAGMADGLSSLAELIGAGPTTITGGVAMSNQTTPPDAKKPGDSPAPDQLAAGAATAASISANHPEVAAELQKQGAQAENTRIRAVLDLAPTGKMSGALVDLAFDGKTTPETGALAILQTDDVARAAMAQNLATDSLEIPALESEPETPDTDTEAEDAMVNAIVAGATK